MKKQPEKLFKLKYEPIYRDPAHKQIIEQFEHLALFKGLTQKEALMEAVKLWVSHNNTDSETVAVESISVESLESIDNALLAIQAKVNLIEAQQTALAYELKQASTNNQDSLKRCKQKLTQLFNLKVFYHGN